MRKEAKGMSKVNHPFWVIVHKEISDHVKSWRFLILIGIIALTCMGSLYTALTNIGAAIKPDDPDSSFLFLKLFTASDGTLPSFVLFINFLGPLLGIALGFDAVNSEQNKGTLSRMLSQPIHRDCIINAKFVAALIVIGIMLFVLGFLVMGFGLIAIGIPPTAEEFWRIVFFLITSIFYVAFWLNLAILFSLRFRQAATSALASVAVWLFFSVFYTMIVNLVAKGLSPSQMASPYQIISYQKFILGLMRLAPSELFNEATTTLLMPSVRSIGPLTMVTQNIFGLIEPIHFRITTGLPQTGFGHYFLVMGIMAGNIRKSGRGLQEISIIELSLPDQQPTFLQERVIFFLFLQSTLFGIVAPTRFLCRLGFDGMKFYGFIAFLDGAVEGAAGFLFIFRLCTDRIHVDHFGITFLVACLHRFQGFIKRSFSVIIDIVSGCKGMVEPACFGVFLRTARPKQENHEYRNYIVKTFLHVLCALFII